MGLEAMAHGWRVVLASCLCVDGAVFYYFRNNMPESPFYLRQHGRLRECRALLSEIADPMLLGSCGRAPCHPMASVPDSRASTAVATRVGRGHRYLR